MSSGRGSTSRLVAVPSGSPIFRGSKISEANSRDGPAGFPKRGSARPSRRRLPGTKSLAASRSPTFASTTCANGSRARATSGLLCLRKRAARRWTVSYKTSRRCSLRMCSTLSRKSAPTIVAVPRRRRGTSFCATLKGSAGAATFCVCLAYPAEGGWS
jgi:hypothetical protein